MPEKELVIVMDDAEKELRAATKLLMRKHGLPCYLFERIFATVHRELSEAAASELAVARANAAAKAAEAEKAKDGGEDSK